MINRFAVQNYKALQNVSLELTPVHALIGPNDSGKTSILQALAALGRTVSDPLQQAFLGYWDGRELVWHGDPEGTVGFAAALTTHLETAGTAAGQKKPIALDYRLTCRFPNSGQNVLVDEEKIILDREIDCQRRDHGNTKVQGVCVRNENAPPDVKQACNFVYELLVGVQYYRWNPRLLALPAATESTKGFNLRADGFGLALCLDDILGYSRELFTKLEQKFCSTFPEISSIKLVRQKAFRSPADERDQVSRLQDAEGKGIYFELTESKQLVPASQASDGTLLILAYLTVLYAPQPPRLILVEEPENGIHPKRLKDVIGILRQLVTEQSRSQVVLTTHSPYAVSLLNPDEVTLCTKKKDGSIVTTRMADSPIVKDQQSLFTLGEIWTAEGDNEIAQAHASAGG